MDARLLPAELQLVADLVRRAKAEGIAMTGRDGLLKTLTKTVIETALQPMRSPSPSPTTCPLQPRITNDGHHLQLFIGQTHTVGVENASRRGPHRVRLTARNLATTAAVGPALAVKPVEHTHRLLVPPHKEGPST